MFTRANFIVVGGLVLTSYALSFILVVGVAVPFVWLWNITLPVLWHAPRLGYHDGVALLLLFFLVRVVWESVRISADLKSPDERHQ